MPEFDSHVKQAKRNIDFLEQSNLSKVKYFDWYITTIFYSALHLINAHIVKSRDLHFNAHSKVNNAINPERPITICPVSEDCYKSYLALRKKSRVSRYLCRDNSSNEQMQKAVYVNEKEFKRAILHLDAVLDYFSTTYGVDFKKTNIHSLYLKDAETKYFSVIKQLPTQ